MMMRCCALGPMVSALKMGVSGHRGLRAAA
jgi:hypothetical protein